MDKDLIIEHLKQKELLDFLIQFVTPHKQELFDEVIQQRTRYLTVVLEDIFQSQNASAVLRTCDCFGIQDVHIIENHNENRVNPDVALGSAKWLTLHKYNESEDNTITALKHLRSQGYKIVASSPNNYDYFLEDLPLNTKTALLLGSELEGLSEKALKFADLKVKIPMMGFTESFNISVSAAIMLYALTSKIKSDSSVDWKLKPHEKTEILLNWARNVVRRSELIEKDFKSRYP